MRVEGGLGVEESVWEWGKRWVKGEESRGRKKREWMG